MAEDWRVKIEFPEEEHGHRLSGLLRDHHELEHDLAERLRGRVVVSQDGPTLFLWGADDRFISAEYYGAAYRAAIPGSRLELVERAGHFPHLEQPEAVVERIRGFVRDRGT